MEINISPIVSGGGFATIRQTVNNNFAEVVNQFDSVGEEMSSNIVFGIYTGDGESEKVINLGAQPIAVEVYCMDGKQACADGFGDWYGGLALRNAPCQTETSNVPIITITNNGFKVYYNSSNRIQSNINDWTYYFKAYMKGTLFEDNNQGGES